MRLAIARAAACGCLLAAGAWADRVTLANGDRVTGRILVLDAKQLIVQSDLMGEVKIDRAAVSSIESDAPLYVTLRDGERLFGPVQAAGGALEVRAPEGTARSVPLETVAALRSEDRQRAWEREERRHTDPPWLDFWSGSISVGLAAARGNARTATFSSGATAQRTTGFDKIAWKYSQIYSTQSTRLPYGAIANRVSGAVRYDRNFGARVFTYGSAQFDFDEFQDLDLRSVLGGGLGYHVLKSEAAFFNLDLGGAWNREKFATGLVRHSGEVVLGEESRHRLTSVLNLFQSLTVNPNLTETGQFRLAFDGGANIRLSRSLNFHVTLTDRYLSNPLPGLRKNDVLLSTGVTFLFEQR
jgi:putative salt-induced outer membrane protein YdiY